MSDGEAVIPRRCQQRRRVVLLHGISRTWRSFRRMQAATEAAGFVTLNIGYASRHKPLEALAEDIRPAIARFADDTRPGGSQ